MAVVSALQVISVTALVACLVGAMNVLFSDGENECEMTYMYEYPQFVRVRVPENDAFPRYALYAYSEGRLTERARKMRFDGVPVLFLPGNTGSHKQVRSLASVALRKSLKAPSRYRFHFDYFTVDFNEEMSGLFGGALERQTSFATFCISAILRLYESDPGTAPSTVIVIGHSMGGIVAKALLTRPENENRIDLMLTLAAPHEAPVLAIDRHFREIYDRIDETWDSERPNGPKNKTLISIGGGERDRLVPSALVSSRHGDINVITTAVPGVWLSADHLCIMWCKQLVLVLNRFLFSIVDPTTKRLTSDSTLVTTMGKHHLRAGHDRDPSRYRSPAEFVPDANWHEDSRRAYSFKHERIAKTWYYMVRFTSLPDRDAVTFMVIDPEDEDWLFGCQAKYVHGQHRICLSGRHLSQFGKWSPSRNDKRRVATLDLYSLSASYPHWTHVLLRISPSRKPVQIHVDIYNKNSRQIRAVLPPMYSLHRRTIIEETETSAIRYNITLPGLEMLYQAYLLYVEPLESCRTAHHHATAELFAPWADGYEYQHFFSETMKSPMRVRLLKGNPNTGRNYTLQASLILTLDPQCRYSISIAASPYDTLGQLSRYYISSLPAYLGAILLLVLRHFAVNMKTKRKGTSFHSALCGEYCKPYYLLLTARLGIMGIVTMPFFSKMSSSLAIGSSASQNFLLLPLLLYLVALGVAHVLGAVCWGFLMFSGQVAHRILIRLVSAGKGRGGNKFWEWITKEIGNIPGFGGFILIIISTASCGAAALAVGAAFYFFLLTKMYEDYLEDFIYKAIAKVAKKIGKMTSSKKNSSPESEETANEDRTVLQNVGENNKEPPVNENGQSSVVNDSNRTSRKDKGRRKSQDLSLCSLHFHFVLFFIWCLMAILNIPTLLTWAHNFKFSRVLDVDPSYYPGLVMSVSAFGLWQIDAPKPNLKYYEIVDKIVFVAAVMSIIVAPISLYRLNYILCSIFALITIHQMLPFNDKAEENEEQVQTERIEDATSSLTSEVNDDSIVNKLEEMKDKLKFE